MEEGEERMRLARIAPLVLALALVAAACGGGNGDGGGDGGGGGGGTEPTGTGGGDAGGSTSLSITAPPGSSNDGFAETSLSVPADTPFTIAFDNQDEGIPHNVQIFEGDETTGTPVWAPADNELITGPAQTTYDVPGLPAGTYTFNCFSHPVTMVGTLTVG
jgi:plastocyanin